MEFKSLEKSIKLINKIKLVLYLLLTLTINCIFSQNYSDYYGIYYAERQLNIDAMDPINAVNTLDQFRYREIFNAYLWRLNETLEVEANLAVDIPAVEDGEDEWEVELKPVLNWPDGEPITGKDVLFTIEVYRNMPINEQTKGIRELANKINIEINRNNSKFFTVSPVDKSNSTFYRDSFIYGFPHLQILPQHILKSKDIIAGDNFSENPIGAGAFYINKVVGRGGTSKKRIDFIRNDGYYSNNPYSITEISAIKETTLDLIINGLRREKSIIKNSITQKLENIGFDLIIEEIGSVNAIKYLRTLPHLRSFQYTRNSWMALAINQDNDILKIKEFRIMLDEMINDQELIKYYDGDAKDITGPYLREFVLGYDVTLKDRFIEDETILKSKLNNNNFKLLNDKLYYQNPITGTRQQVKLTIIFSKDDVDDGSREEMALKKIREYLEIYGIDVTLSPKQDEVFQDDIHSNNSNRNWDLAFVHEEFNWNSNIENLFEKNGDDNITGFYNDKLINLLDNRLKSTGKNKKGYEKLIHQLCYEDLPYIFLWHVKPISYIRRILDNVTITPTKFFTTIDEWEVEPRTEND